MMHSKKIAIALLALVGIFAVAAPAMASTLKLRVYNKTNEAVGDDGTKIKVWVFKYDNGRRDLQKSQIAKPGEKSKFKFNFTDCYRAIVKSSV